jgi:ribonucleoside-diphosphate reductase alpha chain
MSETMEYDQGRLERALVDTGVPRDGLEAYMQRTGEAERFYDFGDGVQTNPEDDGVNRLAVDVFRSKYAAPGETGPLQMWDRIARAAAGVEETEEVREESYREFLGLLRDHKFLPGGRIMHGAGREDARRQPTMSNCYVLPIGGGINQDYLTQPNPTPEARKVRDILLELSDEGFDYKLAVERLREADIPDKTIKQAIFPGDSVEGIYGHLSEAAMVYRSGGGVGTDISGLRPAGASVNSTVSAAPGATTFMHLLSESTETVAQEGRRGALMLTMEVNHPDIYRFISIKDDDGRAKVKHANVSVKLDDRFMRAVEADTDYELRWETADPLSDVEPVVKKVKAREIWDSIIERAHSSAEPGVLFWDRMQEYHNLESVAPLTSTNPCGEQPLASYTACNLSNLNLAAFVQDGEMNYEQLKQATRISTRFLDDIVGYNQKGHALEKIVHAVEQDRRIGLGITGLADALALMGVKYDSEEALEEVDKIMELVKVTAYGTSVDLAEERGAFPLFEWEGYSQSKFVQSLPVELQERIREKGIRNGTVLTAPPVGTGSIIAETASGIEPFFATSYKRRVKDKEGGGETEYDVVDPAIRRRFGPRKEDVPDAVVTSHNIDPYFRVKLQGVLQRHIDTAISSTINLPEDTPVETVADIYITAWKEGLKGVTIYREGSREGVMETTEHADKDETIEEMAGRNGKPPIEFNEEGYIQGREREGVTSGQTEKLPTGAGSLYVTINEDEYGLVEIFSQIGKAGGDAAAQSEAISRLISYGLQAGLDPMAISRQLKGISGPTPVWHEGDQILSTPDGIGKAIERYLQRKSGQQPEEELSKLEEATTEEKPTQAATCPECGSSVTHESNCMSCRHCGWSKC